MEAVPIYIALGSNLEPRAEHLQKARELLARISEGEWLASSIHETEPVGPPGQGPYLNQVVSFLSGKSALELLHFCKGAEVILGRKPRGRWESREIDLDLLYCGTQVIETAHLQVPHPRIAERKFVLEPLCEIAPGWMDPAFLRPVSALLHDLRFSTPSIQEAK